MERQHCEVKPGGSFERSIARLRGANILAFVLVVFLSSTASAADYLFTRIDVPGALHTQPNGLNDRGEISGSYTHPNPAGSQACRQSTRPCSFGFVLSGGVYRTLDVSEALHTFVGG